MRVEIVMPQMGESVAEGTIIHWRKKPGDRIDRDEAILEISTDKVDSEIPSPAAGVLVTIEVAQGVKVPVGTVLATLVTDPAEARQYLEAVTTAAPAAGAAGPAIAAALATAATQAAPAAFAPPSTSPASTPGDRASPVPAPAHSPPQPLTATGVAMAAIPGSAPVPLSIPAAHATAGARRFYSPLVRAIARQEGVGLDELTSLGGTGLGSRVTKRDILAYLQTRREARAMEGPPRAPEVSPLPVSGPAAAPGGVEVVEMDAMRRAIAEHMVRSAHTSPHVTSIHEVDVSRVVAARQRHAEAFERREGIKLTFTPFFVEASVQALREFPWVNSSVEGQRILVKRVINIGVAVALDNGLIVPVIKGADGLNFVGIARAVLDLATRARTRKLTPDDVAGGTFTITNIGVFGTLVGTPIINQPQVAILGTGAIKKRVVVVEDAIAIRDMMYLSLSYDHRVVDGMLAGRFLGRMAALLEAWDPARPL